MSLPAYRAAWLAEIRASAPACEERRPQTRKPWSTGTISEAACLYLRALVDAVQPRVCIEIGTFIGTSALVLAATGARVFTCDKDNAAFPSHGLIAAYQKTASTEMLAELARQRVVADLWFFDGRIDDRDLDAIQVLSHPRTVYAFDDYEGRAKGMINVGKLRPRLSAYRLIAPPSEVYGLASRTTIAVLAPRGAL